MNSFFADSSILNECVLKKYDFLNKIKYANKSYPLHFCLKFVKFVLNYIIQMDGNFICNSNT